MKTCHFRKGKDMFRTTFDRNVLENVKEHFSVWVHVYAGIGLHTQLVFMRAHTLLMRT